MTMMKSGRRLAPVLLALCAQTGLAQTDATPPSPAQSLACLQRPAEPPAYPERSRLDRGSALLRVQLTFESPDRPPAIQVLSNTAREDMQDRAFQYLRQYRLPCLEAQDGAVQAVQEFRFNNTDLDSLPVPDGPAGATGLPFCIVMPREDMPAPRILRGRAIEHVVAAAVFSGDGTQPPEVRILHSTAQPGFESRVRERLQQYRMPCRTGKEAPQALRQQFSFLPHGVSSYRLTRERVTLIEFLSMVEGRQGLVADFDLNTMNCPFKVHYTMYGPQLPNEVRVGGKRDPNKTLFLRWLAWRQLAFSSDQQRNDLFGSTLQIEVPCGALKLTPAADTPAAAASAAP